jgi:hypothetical protein
VDVAITTTITLSVSRTYNLGNYESAKLEASVTVGRDDDDDTLELMRDKALDEVASILNEAKRDHVPSRQRHD